MANPVAVVVSAQPGAANLEARSVEARTGQQPVALGLVAGQVWTLMPSAPGYWGPPRSVFLRPGSRETVPLELWPTGWVVARFQVAEDTELPRTVAVRFAAAAAAGEVPPDGEVSCPLAGQVLRCAVPAGPLDLRLRARGFVSHYRWGAVVQAGRSLDLGELQLRRGGSIVGFVQAPGDRSPEAGCRVEAALREGAQPPDPTDAARRKFLAHATSPNAKGFFQLVGLAPGPYQVTATQPGFAPARAFPVQVMHDAETELRAPLLLEVPASLLIHVQPSNDPWGRWWRLRVLRATLDPSYMETVGDARELADGQGRIEGLQPGSYLVGIEDAAGNRWAAVHAELRGASELPVDVDVGLLTVEGTVALGMEPLAARLWFGGWAGNRRVKIVTDENGRFSGYLPGPGSWRVTIEADEPWVRSTIQVTVERRAGAPRARADIRLPATVVRGRVEDETGKTVAGAVVVARPTAGEMRPGHAKSDKDGRFAFHGLPQGEVVLEGASRQF